MNNNENKNNISFWELIKEDFNVPSLNDPALDSKIELIFNYPGVWAIINYRFANKLYKKGFKKLSRILSGISTFFTKTDIHPACTIGRRVFIDHAIGVIIGETAIIKDDVLIYQNVTLGGVSLNKGKRHPTIESKAIIGAGAKVLGDINIGENSKIGANSVVITDVPNNSTAVGVPARIIKKSKKCSVCRSDQNKLNHCELPDFSKEMFSYMNKRIQILEDIIKKKHNIDIEVEDTKLKKEYDNYISSIEQSEEDNCINKEKENKN